MQTEVSQKMKKEYFWSSSQGSGMWFLLLSRLGVQIFSGLHGIHKRNPHYFWGYVS